MPKRSMGIQVVLRVMLGPSMAVIVARVRQPDQTMRQLVVARNHSQAERRRKKGGQHDH